MFQAVPNAHASQRLSLLAEFDGGDCCECTCMDTAYHICGSSAFDCIDPGSGCGDTDDGVTSGDCMREHVFLKAVAEEPKVKRSCRRFGFMFVSHIIT